MLAIGSDHGGFALKEEIKQFLDSEGIAYKDCGTYDEQSVDYPDIAQTVCAEVLSGNCEKAVLVCGTGIGIGIAANKINGIRAALCCDTFSAKMAAAHNNANVITLGGRVTGPELAKEIVSAFLSSEFLGGRHVIRVDKIMALEKQN
ncbi:MAG: ribose 5-phosphate isomerase B [Ruminococcaceae bacterium]|nr:ribose 5-phosphate isomerase B [Oscillospiraceae bacterium]